MNLVEAMVASVLFALASGCSAQLWGRSVAWSHRLERRQEALQRLDGDLLRQERLLRLAAATAVVPMSCPEATEWMRGQLSAAATDLPEGMVQRLETPASGVSGALWLVMRSETQRIERRRLFTPAAQGLCLPVGSDNAEDA